MKKKALIFSFVAATLALTPSLRSPRSRCSKSPRPSRVLAPMAIRLETAPPWILIRTQDLMPEI